MKLSSMKQGKKKNRKNMRKNRRSKRDHWYTTNKTCLSSVCVYTSWDEDHDHDQGNNNNNRTINRCKTVHLLRLSTIQRALDCGKPGQMHRSPIGDLWKAESIKWCCSFHNPTSVGLWKAESMRWCCSHVALRGRPERYREASSAPRLFFCAATLSVIIIFNIVTQYNVIIVIYYVCYVQNYVHRLEFKLVKSFP